MSLVKNLKCSFGDFTLDIPKWEIADSGITALWGPSGAGKTSVFRALIGLHACSEMEWIFKDIDLAQKSIPERRLGVVFQTFELFPHMTAAQNILFAAEARNVDEQRARQTLSSLTDQLSLSNCINRPVRLLSGGEKQRVALARAVIGEPRFLFLDEPFSALDSDLKIEARKLVREVIAAYDIPTLLITHDKNDLQIAHTTVRLKSGRIDEITNNSSVAQG